MISDTLLQKIELFSNLNKEHLDIIKTACVEMFVRKDKDILTQGTLSNDLYIVLSGKVRIFIRNEDGREIILDDLKEGDFFGEMSLLDDKPRSATVRALTAVRLLLFTKKKFLRIIAQNPTISISILAVMGKRLRKVDKKLSTLAFMDVFGRVANYLLEYAKENGVETEKDRIKIIPPTHKMIADQIGSSPEAVIESINSLVSRDIISIENNEIYISKKQFQIL